LSPTETIIDKVKKIFYLGKQDINLNGYNNN